MKHTKNGFADEVDTLTDLLRDACGIIECKVKRGFFPFYVSLEWLDCDCCACEKVRQIKRHFVSRS